MAGPASPVQGVSVPFCAPLPRHAWEGARQPENASEHLPTQASSSETLSLRLSFSDEQMLFFSFAALQARPLKGQGLERERAAGARGSGAAPASPTFSIHLSSFTDPFGVHS